MPHLLQLALDFAAGAALGLFFFGGLAWTVRRWTAGGGVGLMLTSFLVRAAVLIGGFWLVARNLAATWIACLLGFTAARLLLPRTLSSEFWRARREDKDASHD
jgi:F1F0 ATPase subunit 2